MATTQIKINGWYIITNIHLILIETFIKAAHISTPPKVNVAFQFQFIFKTQIKKNFQKCWHRNFSKIKSNIILFPHTVIVSFVTILTKNVFLYTFLVCNKSIRSSKISRFMEFFHFFISGQKKSKLDQTFHIRLMWSQFHHNRNKHNLVM